MRMYHTFMTRVTSSRRKLHAERQELIRQWDEAMEAMHNRDIAIQVGRVLCGLGGAHGACAQVLVILREHSVVCGTVGTVRRSVVCGIEVKHEVMEAMHNPWHRHRHPVGGRGQDIHICYSVSTLAYINAQIPITASLLHSAGAGREIRQKLELDSDKDTGRAPNLLPCP